MGASSVPWTMGTFLLGPIVLPIYLALRPLKHGEVREGGKAWNILKNFAILWTVVMLIASIVGIMSMAENATGLGSEAATVGAGIGMLLGLGILAAAWFFPTMGAALLGFLLKKNTIVENGPTGPLVGHSSGANAGGGWAALMGVAALGLVAVSLQNIATKRHNPPTPGPEGQITSTASSSVNGEWTVSASTNQIDNTPEVVLQKSGSDDSSLTIRCAERKTEVYVDTGGVVDSGSVRIRLDQSAPMSQEWSRSTDYKALFAPDAIAFSRKLRQAKTFLFEFTPFQERPRDISFDLSGLDSRLQRISDSCNWAEADRLRASAEAADAALRERIAQHVYQCNSSGAFAGQWCWSDPDSDLFDGENPAETREAAIEDAFRTAKMGLAFKSRK
jgi:invasion protein IalB